MRERERESEREGERGRRESLCVCERSFIPAVGVVLSVNNISHKHSSVQSAACGRWLIPRARVPAPPQSLHSCAVR